MSQHREVIIIGSGPAGYTAGIYAARANLSPLLFEGEQPGGQLMLTSDVENFPGFRDPVTGPHLMGEMRAQAERVGCTIRTENVTEGGIGAARRKDAETGVELHESRDKGLQPGFIRDARQHIPYRDPIVDPIHQIHRHTFCSLRLRPNIMPETPADKKAE